MKVSSGTSQQMSSPCKGNALSFDAQQLLGSAGFEDQSQSRIHPKSEKNEGTNSILVKISRFALIDLGAGGKCKCLVTSTIAVGLAVRGLRPQSSRGILGVSASKVHLSPQ